MVSYNLSNRGYLVPKETQMPILKPGSKIIATDAGDQSEHTPEESMETTMKVGIICTNILELR